MLELRKTNSDNTDFKSLVKQLDDFLKITDGDGEVLDPIKLDKPQTE